MPVLSRFNGIIIRMYFQQAEHNPPHIHAIYGDDTAAINIQTGKIIEGDLPHKELTIIRKWLETNQDDLLTIWETQEFKKLPPLS